GSAVVEPLRYSRVLVDTGPIVALLNRKDSQHVSCASALQQIQPPLLTTWVVLTEAAWLLRSDPVAVSKLLQGGMQGLFLLEHIQLAELSDIDTLHRRYQSLSPQLADLTLVHVAHRLGIDTIFTLDRRDFSVFRTKGRTSFRLLPE